MSLPAALLPWIERVFLNATGTGPNASGTLTFYAAGTSTPQNTYSDSALTVPNTNPVTLGADGRPTVDIFLSPTSYKVVVADSTAAEIYTFDNVSDPAYTFFAQLGQQLALGSKSVTTGYTVTNNDSLVTVNEPSTNPAIVNLQPSANRGAILFVQNVSAATQVKLVPNGVETINGLASYTIPVAASPKFPTVILLPAAAGTYYLVGAIGAP